MTLKLNKVLLLLSVSFLLWNCQTTTKPTLTSYVDPFIGSDETDFVSLWRSEAGLYPGAVAPHGMVQLTPETQKRGEYLQGYFYKKDTIRKFSLTEHFSGWPNGSSGKGIFMPFVSDVSKDLNLDHLKSSYDHNRENAVPGFYQVQLIDHNISCSFAALVRSGIASFNFSDEKQKGVLFQGFVNFEQRDQNRFKAELKAGRSEFIKANQKIYIDLKFDQNVRLEVIGQGKRKHYLVFPENEKSSIIQFKIGLSYTSYENACENLESEIPHWNLAKVAETSNELWESELKRIELDGKEADKVTFYTALYHASLLPINATDVNRQFPGFENSKPLEDDETHYIYFTPWDAFRTLHPLVNFINPRKGRDYMRSSLRFYDTYNRVPEPSVMTSVFMSALYADALQQDINFDIKKAYKGLKELMVEKPYFRDKEMKAYDSLGYVPFPMSYATTATLEFAHNDWSLARIAEHMGDKSLADQLYKRSLNYQSQLEPSSRFMRSKNPDGTWAEATIYAEADKWNMSWFAPHDHQGLINLMGGEEAFVNHLNNNFEEGHYVLDNECPMNFSWLFSYANRPDLTMKWARHTLSKFFKNKPYGIPGNDDWGTMSSVYMWGALGLFPAAPGTGELIISGPIFNKITIHRNDKEKITIEAKNTTRNAIYVQNVKLGDKFHDDVFVRMKDLINNKLQFEMNQSPNQTFGKKGKRPYSLTKSTPSFNLKKFNIKTTEVNANQPFEVSCVVKNTGVVGNYLLQIKNEKKTIHSEYFLLREGEEKELKVNLKLFRSGKHVLSVGDFREKIEVLPTKLPVNQALNIQRISIEPLLHKSDKAIWSAKVKNVSSEEVSFQPLLSLNKSVLEVKQEVAIHPGQEIELKGEFQVNDLKGFQTIQLNHGPISQFKVYSHPKETVVVHYDFESKGNKILDQSGFGNHGNIHGNLDWVTSKHGQGIQLQDGYISIPRSVSTEIIGDQMTMLAWYKPVKQKGTAPIISKGGFHMLKLNGKWQLKFAAGSWGRGQCFYNSKPKIDNLREPQWLNEWTHFAGVKDASSIRVFVNGQQKNRLDHNGSIKNSEFEWRIGSNQEHPYGRIAKGILDEVMIFKGALSSEDIIEIIQNK